MLFKMSLSTWRKLGIQNRGFPSYIFRALWFIFHNGLLRGCLKLGLNFYFIKYYSKDSRRSLLDIF